MKIYTRQEIEKYEAGDEWGAAIIEQLLGELDEKDELILRLEGELRRLYQRVDKLASQRTSYKSPRRKLS